MYEQKRIFLPISTWTKKTPKIGIVGHGALGKAIQSCFTDGQTETFICDEKFNLTIDDLLDFSPDITFICYDVELHESGRMDATKTEDAFLKLTRRCKTAIVICSTVTPDIMSRICATIDDPEDIQRFVYWPNMLTHNSIETDIKFPSYCVFGGKYECVNEFKTFMNMNSDMILPSLVILNPIEASYVKCAIDGLEIVKRTFIDELYDSIVNDQEGKVSANNVLKTLSCAPIKRTTTSIFDIESKRGLSDMLKTSLTAYANFTSHSKLLQTAKEVNESLNQSPEEIEIDIEE